MALLTLGLASLPAPKRAADPVPLEEAGATGTPIFSGLLEDHGEYAGEFLGGPFSAFRTYEKMRRADGQVAATLAAIKLPIRCAEWVVRAPKNPTPAEKEARDFVEQCLVNEIDFPHAIENALLMLDFGCAAHEDVWSSDGGYLRLKKLAPRLPMTFYRWEMARDRDGRETEELAALIQQAYRGGNYVTARIPADKLTLFSYQMEGSNFAGRSLLRSMYKHWYIKNALYSVDSIACERNGMGVPTIKMGQNARSEDRAAARTWVTKLVVHESTGIVLPAPDWNFDLKGVTGMMRDAKESIAHHNLQISMAGLAMFLMLGQTQTGARSLGETMSDFFLLSLQATVERIARAFNRGTVRRLCDYNFGAAVRPPKLVPQQVMAVKFETVVDALEKLAQAQMVTGGPEMEIWLRNKMGAPSAPAGQVAPVRRKTVVTHPP